MLIDNIRIALRALAANKLRSSLTMLGIIIGVAAVVALMSVGQGATSSVTSRVQGLGSNLITVSAGRVFNFGPGTNIAASAGGSVSLLYSDYEALLAYQEKHPDRVAGISPAYGGNATVKYGQAQAQFNITGVTPSYLSVRAYELASGRFVSERDNQSEARVVVLGAQAAADIFSGLNPLGRELEINGIHFRVIGLLAEKGSGDDVVLVPLETGYSRLLSGRSNAAGRRTLNSIAISAATSEAVEQVIQDVELVLRRQHKLALSDNLGFSVSSQSQILENLSGITTTLTLFLSAIAAISLLVGGIGIMNITLVSVSERTREIGLRKAVGAQQSDILLQFLIETLTLSIIGGILGILLGAGIAALVQASGAFTVSVNANVVILAFTFAALIGLFFGIYPAYRASRLRPIEALRYE